jgi:predicted RNA binding protein YcfA (HicA-like mRNA interferase family)
MNAMKCTELVRKVERDGWYIVSQEGSHRKYEHATKPGQLIIPFHKGKELATGTANSILKKAGLK